MIKNELFLYTPVLIPVTRYEKKRKKIIPAWIDISINVETFNLDDQETSIIRTRGTALCPAKHV
jgi:hypothetical protein